MRLKTFTADTLSEAMTQVRRELGVDAVIVSTFQGKRGVRITAALEHAPPTLCKEEKGSSVLSALETTVRLLERQHLPREISELILGRISQLDNDILSQNVATVFEKIFSFSSLLYPRATSNKRPQAFMLVGPTGSGKTLATAKLATEYILAGWHAAIITTDGEKAGARQQLSRFAEVLKVPLSIVGDTKELCYSLEKHPADAVVFVDTTGFNPTSAQDLERLSEWAYVLKYPPVLVMPAGLDVYEALDLIEIVKEGLGITCFIHTKVDCCQRFGAMLGAMSKGELHLAYFGCGPELGTRLRPASAINMVEILQRPLTLAQARNQNIPLQSRTSSYHSVGAC